MCQQCRPTLPVICCNYRRCCALYTVLAVQWSTVKVQYSLQCSKVHVQCSTLYCTVQCSAVYCTVLYSVVLYTVLYSTPGQYLYSAQYSSTLHCTELSIIYVVIQVYSNKRMLVGVYLDKGRISDTPESAETRISGTPFRLLKKDKQINKLNFFRSQFHFQDAPSRSNKEHLLSEQVLPDRKSMFHIELFSLPLIGQTCWRHNRLIYQIKFTDLFCLFLYLNIFCMRLLSNDNLIVKVVNKLDWNRISTI